MNIEQTVTSVALPVNSNAMLNRLSELLTENQTNCLKDCKEDIRVKAILWLLNSQVFGQLAVIDMHELATEFFKSDVLKSE